MSFLPADIKNWFFKYWFLIALVTLIAVGMGLGLIWPHTLPALSAYIDPRVATAIVTLLMSISLNGEKLAAALRSPGPVITGFVVNLLIVPLMGLLLFPLQLHVDLKYGLLVAASVPCTLAAASVWTRKAGGNDAISLLVTMTTSAACFITTPFWLSIPTFLSNSHLGGAEAVAGLTLTLSTRLKLAVDLIFGALIPTFLGQALRQHWAIRFWADRRKPQLGGVAQFLILVMVLVSAIKAGGKLAATDQAMGISPFVVVFLCVIAIHIAAFKIAIWASRKLGFRPEDQIAVGLSGSQKTLPTGLLIATELGRTSGMSFALFPMLMFHGAQLLIDTLFVEDYSRRLATGESPKRSESNAGDR